jgi:hypothetical protein
LNTDTPKAFDRPGKQEKPAEKLSPQMAYYLAYAIQNREFISEDIQRKYDCGKLHAGPSIHLERR